MRSRFKDWLAGLLGGSSVTGDWPGSSRTGAAVLARLEALPVGMEVIHLPSQVGAPVGPAWRGWRYRWRFRTEVHAIDRPLTIVQFGICAWDGERWIIPPDNRRYNAAIFDQTTFISWYACPGARIAPGKPAIDPVNWAGSYTRESFRQRWFFIGEDDWGEPFKGEGVVVLLDKD